jgi:hypothetical protein
MRSIDALIWVLVVILAGVALAAADRYRLRRNRMIQEWDTFTAPYSTLMVN